jgi:hypothetical protein
VPEDCSKVIRQTYPFWTAEVATTKALAPSATVSVAGRLTTPDAWAAVGAKAKPMMLAASATGTAANRLKRGRPRKFLLLVIENSSFVIACGLPLVGELEQ